MVDLCGGVDWGARAAGPRRSRMRTSRGEARREPGTTTRHEGIEVGQVSAGAIEPARMTARRLRMLFVVWHRRIWAMISGKFWRWRANHDAR